ncbi:hypothetical protein F6B61_10055 [Salmonella enterica]|uniref:Uncharacterized protein n=22 Tax=Salmonella enterica TaxID=28901 RepID=A0A5V4RMV4_SALER|nr:hypothetical protein [Salmonella enterica subsp. enterica]EAM7337105.1 hypothetical protein [Salmonella enterica]EBL4970349.1 hypothetical protein [Salmonella enterica subsp. enterica serovar Newport]ECJ6226520.1 hypothetical protein [Salmonella enterica subsp. enterica serovar Javiana]ECM4022060.1 hypothetical protein [Salmonella enterica subsp. enterica serovar Montevideo]EDA5743924.1 hypothetical protein [Salmonella enterica subsp. enterica serovar Sandiego]EDN4346667.1 hypothetical pro
MAVATASWFLHKTEKSTCCNSFRVDWVMSPSRGDALFCCVKRSASRQNTVAFLLLLEEPDADKTSHSNNVVVPGASRYLAKVARQTGA